MDVPMDSIDCDYSNSGEFYLKNCGNHSLRHNNSDLTGFVLPIGVKTIIVLIYSLTTLASFFGNVIVIIVFGRGRRCRTDLRPLLINLAASDILMAVFCIPFSFTTEMLKTWIFSKPMCPVILFVQLLSVTVSVFTNVAIGIDRYFAVTIPLKSRVSRITSKKAKYIAIMIIWLVSVCLSIVQLFVGRAKEYVNRGITLTKCNERWPDPDARKSYTLFVWCVTYLFPLTVLFFTYSKVGYLLWRRTAPGNADENRDFQQLLAKRKVVKMLIIVVTMFGVCWLPLHVFILVIDFNPELIVYKSEADEKFFIGVYYCVHWLAMSNSFANPIIYGFTNESFRADLAVLLYLWFPCCHCLRRRYSRQLTVTSYETVAIKRQCSYQTNHRKKLHVNSVKTSNKSVSLNSEESVQKSESIDADDEIELFLNKTESNGDATPV